MSDWAVEEFRALRLEEIDVRYARYRLSVLEAEETMARSLRRYGQIAPVVVCLRDEVPVLVDGFIHMVLYPTLMALAGLAVPSEQKVDGVDLTPLLERKGTLAARPLFWHYPHYSNQGGRPGSAVRVGNDKLLESFEDDRVELYDLAKDVGEQLDFASERPGPTGQMKKLLGDWRRAVDAQMPTPNPSPVDPFGPRGIPAAQQ